MKLNALLCSEWQISITLAFAFLPWIVVVLFTAGAWGAMNLLWYAIVVFAAGYSVLCLTLPASYRSRTIALAPAVGILSISALTAFWVRLGLPLLWSMALWLALTAAGVSYLWRDRVSFAKSSMSHGRTLTVLSALICAVFFLPSACRDMVQRRDGSFTWKYRDTQHFQAIAASIKNGGSPPKTPGTATADLLYHFGPYAPAAAISRLDRLNLNDAVARVTRGASLWALVLASFGVGTLLSVKATGSEFGGIMSVAGLFFYGSLLSLFSGDLSSSGHWTGGILFTIPDVMVYDYGGPFIYLLAGHSLLHGLVAITAIMGLCLAERERESSLTWRALVLVLLPAFAVPVNSVAALYCVGVAGILLFWGRLDTMQSWLSILLMFCLFFSAWKIMGYDQSLDTVHAAVNFHMAHQWWLLVVSFLVGLGFRVVGFGWISNSLKDAHAALVLSSVLGLLSFFLVFQFRDGNERYGILFLQSIFSIFAFSRVTPGFWRAARRSQTIAEWLSIAKTGMIVLTAAGGLIGCVAIATHRHTGIDHFGRKLFLSLLILLLLVGMSGFMKHSPGRERASSAILMGTLMAWCSGVDHGLDQIRDG